MLPLADTEKLIREKDEEVSKHFSFPQIKAPNPLRSPFLALPAQSHCLQSCPAQLRRMQEMLEKMQAQMQQNQAQGEQSDAL